MASISIILVDDHRIMRQGLKALLEESADFQVIGEADSGQDGVHLVQELKPDVLVLDMALPDIDGVTVVREAMRLSPLTVVIILSMHNVEGYVRKALRAGALAYVLKDSTSSELITAIREALAGRRYLSQSVAQRAFDFFVEGGIPAPLDPNLALSKREREVLPYLAGGQTARQIGDNLGISPRTIEFHRHNIMHKLGLKGHKELVRFCIRTGIFPEDRAAI